MFSNILQNILSKDFSERRVIIITPSATTNMPPIPEFHWNVTLNFRKRFHIIAWSLFGLGYIWIPLSRWSAYICKLSPMDQWGIFDTNILEQTNSVINVLEVRLSKYRQITLINKKNHLTVVILRLSLYLPKNLFFFILFILLMFLIDILCSSQAPPTGPMREGMQMMYHSTLCEESRFGFGPIFLEKVVPQSIHISGHEMGIYEEMHVHYITWEDRDLDDHDNDATDVITQVCFVWSLSSSKKEFNQHDHDVIPMTSLAHFRQVRNPCFLRFMTS